MLAHHYAGQRHRVIGFAPEASNVGLAALSPPPSRQREGTTIVIWDENTRVEGGE